MVRSRPHATFAILTMAFAAAAAFSALPPGRALAQQGATPAPAGPKGIPVAATQAATACFSEAIRVTGFLAARSEAVVALTQVGYAVAEILVHEGDAVTEGEPVARLARIEGPNPYGEGGAQAAAAAAAQAAAAGQGQSAQSTLPASIVLRAPAAGVVVASQARIGAAASPRGDPLFRIAIDGRIEAAAEVSSLYLSQIKRDQSVRVGFEDGRDISGRVRQIGSEIDPATQMGIVRVALDGDAGLRAGRLIRVTIDARHSCGVSVPRSAVSYATDGPSVQVVRDRVIETVRVRVGLTSAGAAEIEAGLHAGDLVVVNAGASLRDGDIVDPAVADDSGQPERR